MTVMGPELEQLAVVALDLALRNFSQGEQNPFIIYINELGHPQRLIIADHRDVLDATLLDSAREVVSRTLGGAVRYAIAYNGYITIGGNHRDAAFIEAGERGNPEAFVLAQPYRIRKKRVLPQKKKREAFVRLGPQLIVARVAQLLDEA